MITTRGRHTKIKISGGNCTSWPHASLHSSRVDTIGGEKMDQVSVFKKEYFDLIKKYLF
jgi:hypothetical protein